MSQRPLWETASRKPEKIKERLADIVAFARANSPYYRDLYKNLPASIENPSLLPVTDKKTLMASFDAWVTDREVTIERVRKFIEDPNLVGEKFLGRYLVATTAGTTGTPGIFVLDDNHMRGGTSGLREAFRTWLSFGDFVRIVVRGARFAALHATGGHFVSVAGFTRARRSSRVLAKLTRDFSVHAPIKELVNGLNEFRPAVVLSYASIVSLLAREQELGRLRIKPVLLVLTAEGLAEEEYGRIAKAFGAKVRSTWGSTEIGGPTYSCAEGWLHVVGEWIILEPVDADHRPTSPGEQSHTVLVTNLANRVQPILRYDLGDRVLQRPDPCPCGNPLPAIRIQGRSAEVLRFPIQAGEDVSIPPLAFEIDHVPGVDLSQVVQTTPTNLRIRLRFASGADPNQVWQKVHGELKHLLARHELHQVTIERAEEPPEQGRGGKFRAIIPLPSAPRT
ncbi:MAG: phenylacetate--CoA ligase family protein [Rhodospirillales bacterium]|nr:phenylacetate--CoA ligase family protein [Rhodospirillales bacterium]